MFTKFSKFQAARTASQVRRTFASKCSSLPKAKGFLDHMIEDNLLGLKTSVTGRGVNLLATMYGNALLIQHKELLKDIQNELLVDLTNKRSGAQPIMPLAAPVNRLVQYLTRSAKNVQDIKFDGVTEIFLKDLFNTMQKDFFPYLSDPAKALVRRYVTEGTLPKGEKHPATKNFEVVSFSHEAAVLRGTVTGSEVHILTFDPDDCDTEKFHRAVKYIEDNALHFDTMLLQAGPLKEMEDLMRQAGRNKSGAFLEKSFSLDRDKLFKDVYQGEEIVDLVNEQLNNSKIFSFAMKDKLLYEILNPHVRELEHTWNLVLRFLMANFAAHTPEHPVKLVLLDFALDELINYAALDADFSALKNLVHNSNYPLLLEKRAYLEGFDRCAMCEGGKSLQTFEKVPRTLATLALQDLTKLFERRLDFIVSNVKHYVDDPAHRRCLMILTPEVYPHVFERIVRDQIVIQPKLSRNKLNDRLKASFLSSHRENLDYLEKMAIMDTLFGSPFSGVYPDVEPNSSDDIKLMQSYMKFIQNYADLSGFERLLLKKDAKKDLDKFLNEAKCPMVSMIFGFYEEDNVVIPTGDEHDESGEGKLLDCRLFIPGYKGKIPDLRAKIAPLGRKVKRLKTK